MRLIRTTVLLTALASITHAETVWNGVYTKAQAARGEVAYRAQCSSCHNSDFSGASHVLQGASFMGHWREDNVGSFFQLLKATMPMRAPASLSDRAYLDIVAFILEGNGFPAGKSELTLAKLDSIRIEDKDGPKPVPDFALVKASGCLTRAAKGEWIVDHATPAVRTRIPGEAPAADLKAAATPSGSGVFHFLDLAPYDAKTFRVDERKGHKVEVKGFLIRKNGMEILNLTSVGDISPTCP